MVVTDAESAMHVIAQTFCLLYDSYVYSKYSSLYRTHNSVIFICVAGPTHRRTGQNKIAALKTGKCMIKLIKIYQAGMFVAHESAKTSPGDFETHEKLYGSVEELMRTTTFITRDAHSSSSW
jgi:hypothetical protein